MSTFAVRSAQFVSDRSPPAGAAVELLCEDHCGTYLLPFPCSWTANGWINARTDEMIEAQVVGWRERG